jgi:hypothetical protein
MKLNPLRVIARHRAAKAQERQAFQAIIVRLVAELEGRPDWERRPYRRRKNSAQIIAEQAWERRGFTPSKSKSEE